MVIDSPSDPLFVRYTIRNCSRCPLRDQTSPVHYDGPPDTILVVIAEAPGKDEEASGYPLIGKCGKVFNEWLGYVGISRDKVFCMNVVSCRPPKNRTPHSDEIDACSINFNMQLDLVCTHAQQPFHVLALGDTAGDVLNLGARGIPHDKNKPLKNRSYTAWKTYHPGAILRNPSKQTLVKEHLANLQYGLHRTLKDLLEETHDFDLIQKLLGVDINEDSLTNLYSRLATSKDTVVENFALSKLT